MAKCKALTGSVVKGLTMPVAVVSEQAIATKNSMASHQCDNLTIFGQEVGIFLSLNPFCQKLQNHQ